VATVGVADEGHAQPEEGDQALKENGWTQARGGKHQVKMTKEGCRPITLPQHKGRDYPTGLARAILKRAGLG
jgi:predicted RNA binding protein YcfA (HicA-like mRNA interferase family)